MDGWQSPIRPSLRTSLIVDPPDGRIPPLSPEGQKRRADRAAAARARAPEVSVRTLASTYHALHYGQCSRWTARARRKSGSGEHDRQRGWRHRRDPDSAVARICSDHHAGRIPTSESFRWMDVRCRRRMFARGLVFRAVTGKGTRSSSQTIELQRQDAGDEFPGSTENLKMTERFTLVNPTTIKYKSTLEDTAHVDAAVVSRGVHSAHPAGDLRIRVPRVELRRHERRQGRADSREGIDR